MAEATLAPFGRLLYAPNIHIRAVKLSGAETTIERKAVDDFRSSLQGTLFAPGQDGYDNARRVWNGMSNNRPALIARCADLNVAVRAATFARERALLLAVRERAGRQVAT